VTGASHPPPATVAPSRPVQIFNGNVTGTGFSHVPGGSNNRDKSVLSFHYYCWFIDIAGTNITNLTRIECDLGLGGSACAAELLRRLLPVPCGQTVIHHPFSYLLERPASV
jgi:hypothetical protein